MNKSTQESNHNQSKVPDRNQVLHSMQGMQDIHKLLPLMVKVRRHIHQRPESGSDQPETVRYLASQFKNMSVDLRYGKDHVGLVVDIQGYSPGPIIAFRADTDALEINEPDDPDHLPAKKGFQSKNRGKMHACGHDTHSAILLGLGMFIHKHRQRLNGSIRLLFQPGEEGYFGASRMIEKGYLEGVENVFALHCYPQLRTGQIGYRKGSIFASVDKFTVTISGKGGHGSTPELASDQVLALCRTVENLNTILSRRISAAESAVLSIGYIHAGAFDSKAVLPEKGEFAGTVRTFHPRVQEQIKRELYRICEASAQSVHPDCKAHIEYQSINPPTVNSETVVNRVTTMLSPIISQENLLSSHPPLLISEDFSLMLVNKPGAMFLLGTTSASEDITTIPFLHSPYFDIDEQSMAVALNVFATLAFEYHT